MLEPRRHRLEVYDGQVDYAGERSNRIRRGDRISHNLFYGRVVVAEVDRMTLELPE